MASLSQRKRSPVKEKLHPATSSQPAQRPAPPQAFLARGRVRAIISAVLISIILVINRKSGFQSSKTLPHSYTLCTRDGPAIYTVDPDNTVVECIVVDGKHIVDVGSFEQVNKRNRQRESSAHAEGLLAVLRPAFPVRRLRKGAVVVPGIADAHAHILSYGQSRQLDVSDCQTASEVVQRTRQFILAHPDVLNDTSVWIEGSGYDHTRWPGGQFPVAADFESDDIVRQRPIIVNGKDYHSLWVSQTILDKFAPYPDIVDGGFIIRDDKGRPTGIFVDKAMELIQKPKPTEQQKLDWFSTTMNDALAHGLTSIHDAGLDAEGVPFFKRLADANKLPIRIYAMRFYEPQSPYWGDKAEKLIDYADSRLSVRSVKIFSDGALRSGGAALHEPYADDPSTRGILRISPDELAEVVPRFLKDGWQNTHCIGDRANGIFLDVVESVDASIVTAMRPRIEHAQILTPSDQARVGRLGVIASMQPSHCSDDMWYAEEKLGPERIKWLYAWRSLVDGGARMALGSDMPVEGVNPLVGFYSAVTRLDAVGNSPQGPDGWFPEQRLTRSEALRGMTIDALVVLVDASRQTPDH